MKIFEYGEKKRNEIVNLKQYAWRYSTLLDKLYFIEILLNVNLQIFESFYVWMVNQ